jgi:hypothetical protein
VTPQLITIAGPAAGSFSGMPFTVSHAAAVLPLRRFKSLPLAALMIGSMSPDFSYFTPWTLYLYTHNIPALFWFCWPVGLALWLLFVRVIEAPTLVLLPEGWRARFAPSERPLTAGLLFRASVAIVAGAATHIAWDAFTHGGTPVTHALPFMRAPVFEVGGYAMPLYKLLQHLSTLFGLAVLAIWAWRLKPGEVRSNGAVTRRARIGATLAVLTTSIVWALANAALHSANYLEAELFHLAVGGMVGWAIAWISIAVVMNLGMRARRESPSSG